MVSVGTTSAASLSLGNFSTNANGTPVLDSAGGSGLNDQALIAALVQARTTGLVTPVQDQVTLNTNKITALQQFNTLMTTLQGAASQLSNPPGFNQATNNAFAAVTASVNSSTGVAGSTYLSVSATAGTPPQTFTLGTTGLSPQPAIIQLAQATQQVSNTFSIATADTAVVSSTPVANQFGAGTFTVKGVSITLNDGDSLNTVAGDFNAVSAQTGISANVVQIASGSYDLQFTGQTGFANDFSLNPSDSNTVVSDPSSLLTNVSFSNQQTAQDSQFVLNGQTIDRATNSVSDAISGITFNLLQATPSGTTLSVGVTPNTTAAETGIVSFMNAYNAVMTFYANQTQLNSDGTYASTDYLATDPQVTSTVNQLQSQIANAVSGISGQYNSLASLGITFTNLPAQTDSTGKQTQPAVNNALNFDQTTLEAALASNFSQVQAVFGFTFTSNNANLAVNTRTNNLSVNNFTLNIDPGSSTFQATYTDGTGSHTVDLTAKQFSIGGGYVLTGQAGTALDGLSMLYGSTSAATINVTATQGIGDWINNFATALTQTNTGGIALDESALTTSNTTLNATITQYTSQISAYQDQLTTEYSNLETAISQANTLLATLNAQSVAQLSSNSAA